MSQQNLDSTYRDAKGTDELLLAALRSSRGEDRLRAARALVVDGRYMVPDALLAAAMLRYSPMTFTTTRLARCPSNSA
jgi:hypothetical protein